MGSREVDAVLVVVGGWVEGQVGDDVVSGFGGVIPCANRVLRLQDKVDGKGLILEIELGGKKFHVDFLRVIVVLCC